MPHLVKLVLNDVFHVKHNFGDDNTLACFGKIIQELTGFLESQCEAALNWFNGNKLTVYKVSGRACR